MKATVRELESKLLRTSGDKERLEVLLELARAHATEFQNREGLRAAREALAIARRLRNSIGVGQALSAATLCHYQRGDHVSAVATGLDAVEAYADGDLLGRSRALQSIALALFAVEAFELAEQTALRAVEDARAARDREREAYAGTVYGYILADRGRFNEARRQFRSAAAYYRAADDRVRLKKLASNLGHTYRKQGIAAADKGANAQARLYWKRAIGVYQIALDSGRHDPDDAIILGAIAECECRRGESQAAHATVMRALAMARGGHNASVHAHCHLWEGHILKAMGDLGQAVRAYDDARVFASALEHDEVLAQSLRGLAIALEAGGNATRAAEVATQAARATREREAFLAQVRDELGPMWNQYTGDRPPTAVGRSAA
jgi:tetratricopeptide (TPR) repeat protein